MIHLTQAAVGEVERLRLKQKTNVFLRLAVKNGGCSGWFYDMSFDKAIRDSDRIFDCSGIQIVVEEHNLDYIYGLTLDYSEDLMGGGFRFHNPSAIATCGCGNSFAI
jgi:iron-sulfur cluster assembly accessory protein